MGLSTALEIGRTGLTTYRVAQEVTGENIANVNTPGYSRQRVTLDTSPPVTYNGFPLGTGVRISAVDRYYDSLLQQQLINAQTTQGFDTAKSTVLQQIEPSFNEVTNDGIGTAIVNYFSSWQDLSLNPSGVAERQVVLTRAQILADNFHSVSTSLNNAIATQNSAQAPLVDTINSTLTNIAQLNEQIRNTQLVAGNANEIKDRRDQLVRDLSLQVGISFKENSDGTTDISLAENGMVLVAGSKAGSFALDKNNPASYSLQLLEPGGVLRPVSISKGQLGAVFALRDSIIPGYLSQVDTLAKAVIDAVNTQHAAGFSPGGGTGQNFFTPQATVAGAAAAFSIDAGLSISTIAASGNAVLPGDNSNAYLLAGLSSKPLVTIGTTTVTFSSYYGTIVTKVGSDVQAIKTTVSQDEAFTKQLSTLRESNSGVSLDEEMTNLIKYQRSYQASAKLITTATEMLDTVLAMIR